MAQNTSNASPYPASDPLMKLSAALKWLKDNAGIDPPLTYNFILSKVEDGTLQSTRIGNLIHVKKSSLIKLVNEIQQGVH